MGGTGASPPPTLIHVHRLNIVGAGRCRKRTVGTATSAILVNICCETWGHSEWALIPTQPCWGGKHSFLLVSVDKQGRGVLLVTCRQPASWKDRECWRLRGPQLCRGPLWLCRRVWPPAAAASWLHWSSWMDLGFEVNERWCDWARWGGSGGVRLVMLKQLFVKKKKNVTHDFPYPMWLYGHIGFLWFQGSVAAAFMVILHWVL